MSVAFEPCKIEKISWECIYVTPGLSFLFYTHNHLDFKAAAFSSSVFKMVAILVFSALFLLPI